jgi:hypothetical protein
MIYVRHPNRDDRAKAMGRGNQNRRIGSRVRTFRADVDAREAGRPQRQISRVFKPEDGAMMENTACDTSISNPSAVESLAMLLDYAIAEGTELRLPAFVLLLRMASLELATSGARELHDAPACVPEHHVERVAS